MQLQAASHPQRSPRVLTDCGGFVMPGEVRMVMTCDACHCARPVTWWTRDTDAPDVVPDLDGWQMCGHCSNHHAGELEAQGYELWVDERVEVVA